MNREKTLHILEASKQTLMERFAVTRLALFGSTVRND